MSTSTNRLTQLAADAAAKAVVVFRKQGWTWSDSDTPPTVQEIAASLSASLTHVRDDPRIAYSRSGRFRVTRQTNWDEGYKLGPDELHVSLELGEIALADGDPQVEPKVTA